MDTAMLLARSSRSMVKSIQAGNVTIAGLASSGTTTITAVNLSNAIIFYLGATFDTSSTEGNVGRTFTRVELTNTTTVTAARGTATSGTAMTVSYVVIEFLPGVIKKVQRGTINLSGGNSATATLSPAFTTVNKAFVSYLGHTANDTTFDADQFLARLTLTNTTTVTADRVSNASDSMTVGYQAIEFY
jgi:hypothetical protein